MLARKKGFDPLSDEFTQELEHNKEFAEVVVRFFDAILHILWQKSYVLRLFVLCARFPRQSGEHRLPPVQQNAVRLYQDYAQALRRVVQESSA